MITPLSSARDQPAFKPCVCRPICWGIVLTKLTPSPLLVQKLPLFRPFTGLIRSLLRPFRTEIPSLISSSCFPRDKRFPLSFRLSHEMTRLGLFWIGRRIFLTLHLTSPIGPYPSQLEHLPGPSHLVLPFLAQTTASQVPRFSKLSQLTCFPCIPCYSVRRPPLIPHGKPNNFSLPQTPHLPESRAQ